ncbi:hypothetical protein, partial [uncultured Desulfovibrio sp.]|uniref:hypothetical protein n=1 Tax=uncultured Desulfovibrio sp. TaxID=167968 RepID=UPI00262428C1
YIEALKLAISYSDKRRRSFLYFLKIFFSQLLNSVPGILAVWSIDSASVSARTARRVPLRTLPRRF